MAGDRFQLPGPIESVAHRVIGVAMEVHSVLGPGPLEAIYEEALVFELQQAEIPVLRQVEIGVPYKQVKLKGQRIDLLVDRTIVVEIKAVSTILDVHKAQTLSYIRAGGYPLGLLLNFHAPSLRDDITRLVNSAALNRPAPASPRPLSSSRPSR